MNCQNCKAEMLSQWHFCPACGAASEKTGGMFNLSNKAFVDVFNKIIGVGTSSSSAPDGNYGAGVRKQVFEVIVRQALIGAPWQQICAGPMMVNSITVEEVEDELRRRRGGDSDGPPDAGVPKKPHNPEGGAGVSLSLPTPPPSVADELTNLRDLLLKSAKVQDLKEIHAQINKAVDSVNRLANRVQRLEQESIIRNTEAALQDDLTRELGRTTKPYEPGNNSGPYPIN